MKDDFKRNISLTGELKYDDPKIKEPHRPAAGYPGIRETLKHTFREMGVIRSGRALFKLNQEDGFRCPSCAWPVPEHPSPIAEYCENGAKALADEATREHIGADFFSKNSVEALSQLSDYELNKLGRITEPLVMREGQVHYQPISWNEAYELIAGQLRELEDPNEAIFYTSGRSSNEAAYLYGMFARAYGTNNMPDCSNMCHESSGVALSNTLGIGKGSTKLEDLYGAEVILIAGQNPGTNHPRMLSALEKCKQNGGKIISINPLAETGLVNFRNPQKVSDMLGPPKPIADIHLPIKINEDLALVKLLLKKLAERENKGEPVFDHEFINTYTEGFGQLIDDLEHYDKSELLERTGLAAEDVDAVADLLASKSDIVVCWAMGLTQHKNAVATIQEYVNLLLVKGALGKPHAGTCPVRGHSNVQGDRSVGIQHFVDEALNSRIRENLGFEPPTEAGYDTVEAIKAMHEERASVFIALGGNLVMAASDTAYTAEAFRKCTLTVQISTKLNRSHLVTGKTALILPTYGRSEKDMQDGKLQFLTMESSTGKVRQSKGLLKPASGNIKSEPAIIAGIADAYFQRNHPMDWVGMAKDYNLIREAMDKTVKGFEKTSQRSSGFGFYLPNNVRELDFSSLPNGKAQITVNKVSSPQLEKDELLLMTIRSHDQFNTTIYGLDDRYRGVYGGRRVIFMNRKDMEVRGLAEMDRIDLHSTYDGETRKAQNFRVISYDIPQGNAAAYFPETNFLVPHHAYSDKSQTPISKSIRVTVHKC